MYLKINHIHVWQVALDWSQDELEQAQLLLSVEEQARKQRFVHSTQQNYFLAARAALRTILSHYLATEPASLNLVINEHGKPYLADQTLAFNLTHSHQLALVAVSYSDVGIDVEYQQPKSLLPIARRFFHTDEIAYLENLPQQQQLAAVYQMWTRKEAIVKCLGQGLLINIKNFCCLPTATTTLINQQTIHYANLNLTAEYAAAVASTEKFSWEWFSYTDFFRRHDND